jgi:hypothetical protein
MPRTAGAADLHFPRVYPGPSSSASGSFAVAGNVAALRPADRAFLLELERQALDYFLENQTPCGLILDRQHNHGPRRPHGTCSTSATGMGFIALALASAPPFGLVTAHEAGQRIAAGLRAVLERLPHEHGVVPHFIDSVTGQVYGNDYYSTIETSWLVTGGLWAAAFLCSPELALLAVVRPHRLALLDRRRDDLPGRL